MEADSNQFLPFIANTRVIGGNDTWDKGRKNEKRFEKRYKYSIILINMIFTIR